MEPDDDQPVSIPITDIFDLHTVPPRDVQAVVEEYLNEAHRMGFRALPSSTAGESEYSGRW